MMKKKKLLRFSKRLLILLLCSTLVSGTCFNKYKISANATTVVGTLTALTLKEICIYVGTLVLAGIGTKIVVDSADDVAAIGKDFIDSVDLSGVSDWMLTKVDASGQSYVYGSEALQLAQETAFSVIQGGGGNKPDDDDDGDNDGDGDGGHMIDIQGLGEIAIMGTVAFYDWFKNHMENLISQMDAGESTFMDAHINPDLYKGEAFTGYTQDADGNYIYSASSTTRDVGGGHSEWEIDLSIKAYKYPQCLVYESTMNGTVDIYRVYGYVNNVLTNVASTVGLRGNSYANGLLSGNGINVYRFYVGTEYKNGVAYQFYDFSTSLPIFSTVEAAKAFFETGDLSGCINVPGNYRIADWLKENWTGSIDAMSAGIRSLQDNMLLVGEAAKMAMNNQLNGLGYVEALMALLAGNTFPLPGAVSDPEYFPENSPRPELAPEELPWPQSEPVPDPEPTDPKPTDPEPTEPEDPKMKFGINTIFSILLLLIMIIIMLLIIFLSCLAFIIMIFRIQATTGFLPDEMVAALNYLKTLQIPGFGMSVYSFFMSLIYIILIFTIIGILRKNIDKIKFPRKGGK